MDHSGNSSSSTLVSGSSSNASLFRSNAVSAHGSIFSGTAGNVRSPLLPNHPSVLEGRTCTLVVVQCTQEAGHKVDTGAGATAQITIEVEDIAQVVDTTRVEEDTAVVEEDTTVIKEDDVDVDVDINVDMDVAGVPHTSLLQWYVNISNFICKTYII